MKKIIIMLILLAVLLIGAFVNLVIKDKQAQAVEEARIAEEIASVLDEDGTLSKDELTTLNEKYPPLFTSGDDAINYLEAITNFAEYEITSTGEDYYEITVMDDEDNSKVYIVYDNGLYFVSNDDLELENDQGIITSPKIAIMIALDALTNELDSDNTYHVSQAEDAYQISIVSKAAVQAGEDGVLSSYYVNYDGTYYLSVS